MPGNYKIKNPDTQFLRALAILLIINSHLDSYYPIPYLGTGGAIGNSVFFFLSAFGLYLSQQKLNKNFKDWMTNRISRIYPSLWIVLILLSMPVLIWQGKLSYSTITTFMGYFFNPPFWFLQALLIFNLLAFPLFTKYIEKINVLVIIGILCLIFIISYVTVIDRSIWSIEKLPFNLIHYFMVFIFGIYIAQRKKYINYSGYKDSIFLIFVVGFYYFHKYLMMKGIFVIGSPVVSRIVDFVANHTLEIYMVHETISPPVVSMQMPFPVNIIVFLILTFALSAIVHYLADAVRNKIIQTI